MKYEENQQKISELFLFLTNKVYLKCLQSLHTVNRMGFFSFFKNDINLNIGIRIVFLRISNGMSGKCFTSTFSP